MVKAIRLTKKELLWLIALVDTVPVGVAVRSTTRDKLALAELSMRNPDAYKVTVKDAVAAMTEILGPGTVAIPAAAPPLFYMKLTARMKSLGLTLDNFRAMARGMAKRGWRPPYSFEKMVWQADQLMLEGTDEFRKPSVPAYNRGPTQLDEL